MARYIIRRVLWGIVLLILVSLLTFLVFYVFPAANPAALRAGRQPSPKVIAYITHALGLDKPIYVQFWDYMKGIVLHFNFGYSYYSQQSVLSLIINRLPATISLTVGAVVLWVAIGVPVGIISAVMRGRPLSRRARMTMLLGWLVAVLIPVILFVVATPDWGGVFLLLWALTGVVILVVFFAKKGDFLDRSAMGTSLAFVSMPVFWLGLIVIFLFASDIGKFPILPGANSYVGLTLDPWEWFKSLLLPWFVLAATQAAIYSRLLRGSLLEVMGADYIRTARAKGVRESRVIWHHGVRFGDNAGGHRDRNRHRRPARRRRSDRDCVRHPGDRSPQLQRDRQHRYPDRAGDGAPCRHVHRRGEYHRRHLLRLSRSASALLVRRCAVTPQPG